MLFQSKGDIGAGIAWNMNGMRVVNRNRSAIRVTRMEKKAV